MTIAAFLMAAFASTNVVSCFESFKSRSLRTQPLFGTLKFSGTANARVCIPPPIITEDEDKSLSKFLTTPASDTVLLGRGTSTCTRMDGGDSTGEGGELWECRQASIGWFGMKLVPVFINRIEKNPAEKMVVVSIIDAKTEVQDGRLGNTLASAMKKSKFQGRNAITWKEQNDADDASNTSGGARSCDLEGNLKLTLTITLPPFLPLPPGFNAIGSKIVERTCAERLRQNLIEVSDAYLIWATSP
jgi:hypothetical protein